MIEFREPRLEDKQWVQELLQYSEYNNSEYSFGLNYIWRRLLQKGIARHKDLFLAKSNLRGGAYLFPAGTGDWKEAIELYREDAKKNGIPLRLYSVTPEMAELLKSQYDGQFTYEPLRYAADYVYRSSDLIELKGRKYHGKRNHISRFETNNPDWAYEDITADNLEQCREMFQKWLEENQDKQGLEDEKYALYDSFDHFEELGFQGGLIRAGGQVVAFTIGEELTRDCFVLHFEKAFSHIQGAYPMINREFAARRLSGYRYINREEDMDIPGLRKSKMSYQPAMLVERGYALFGETL